MTRSKSGALAKLPKEQKCHFLIGPVGSWFMPNVTDIWTQEYQSNQLDGSPVDTMDHDKVSENYYKLSYFAYGSIGCFCYGEIHHRPKTDRPISDLAGRQQSESTCIQPSISNHNQSSVIVNRLIDIKDDNSRVACLRFLKDSTLPLLLVLTENGSLLMHDCYKNENIFSFKKSEVLTKFVAISNNDDASGEHSVKRAKFNVTQQINSCSWPTRGNIFLGVSLLKEKKCILLRLKLNNVINTSDKIDFMNKSDVVFEHEKIDLELQQYANPICLIESAMLDTKICIVAVAMDDGLITVVVMNLETNKKLRTIKLARHSDQICSMSINLEDTKKFPLGLLATVSRDGLVLIWDIENEFYFADYSAAQSIERPSGSRINWFALTFIKPMDSKQVLLAISNPESGVTLLEIPENARSKIRLKDNRDSKHRRNNINDQTLRHNALIFNIEYDPLSETMITSSLDGNHLIWSIQRNSPSDANRTTSFSLKPQFLNAAMLNNARVHMIRHNSIREDLMCLALGKGGVKFYTITEDLTNSRFDMTPSCALVARKVAKASVSPTSVAWHPNHEYRLAIGTLEGKVYRADITPRKASLIEADSRTTPSESKKSTTQYDDVLGVDYQPLNRDTNDKGASSKNINPKTDGVYSLSWGPNPASPQDVSKYAIYAISSVSHKLSIYYTNKDSSDTLTNYLDEFHDHSLPEAVDKASEVTWKSSMDLMALGTTDGRILIVSYLDESHQDRSNNRLFKVITTISGPLGDTFVQCLAWHPTTDVDDSNYYKIAASSNASPAFVFNLKETILVADVKERLKLKQSDSGDKIDSMNILAAYSNKLEAHQKAITDIAWNPHEPDQIATCSFDRNCYVWSLDGCLMDAQIISKFSARDRIFTLEWSLVDTDLIYISGNESIIWAWRPSENRQGISETKS